jgi:hypothetical protein
MKRIHLFEFTDLSWFPRVLRQIQTDYLQFVVTRGSAHKNLMPLIIKAFEKIQTNEIVDLCSGGTGPWMLLQEEFELASLDVYIKLTDKYPDPESIQRWRKATHSGIEYLAESIDATRVPKKLGGMRTLFEGFHHFKPEQAHAILQDAVEKNVPIGIFEASLKPGLGWILLLLTPLMTVLGYFFVTPFIKPRTLSRFFWTYFVPIAPLTTSWDGIVSFLRVYSSQELQKLITPLQNEDYTWEISVVTTGTPMFDYTYLLEIPNQPNTN